MLASRTIQSRLHATPKTIPHSRRPATNEHEPTLLTPLTQATQRGMPPLAPPPSERGPARLPPVSCDLCDDYCNYHCPRPLQRQLPRAHIQRQQSEGARRKTKSPPRTRLAPTYVRMSRLPTQHTHTFDRTHAMPCVCSMPFSGTSRWTHAPQTSHHAPAP